MKILSALLAGAKYLFELVVEKIFTPQNIQTVLVDVETIVGKLEGLKADHTAAIEAENQIVINSAAKVGKAIETANAILNQAHSAHKATVAKSNAKVAHSDKQITDITGMIGVLTSLIPGGAAIGGIMGAIEKIEK